jgi:hypothetical protein
MGYGVAVINSQVLVAVYQDGLGVACRVFADEPADLANRSLSIQPDRSSQAEAPRRS